jgi:hypothetical protein
MISHSRQRPRGNSCDSPGRVLIYARDCRPPTAATGPLLSFVGQGNEGTLNRDGKLFLRPPAKEIEARMAVSVHGRVLRV